STTHWRSAEENRSPSWIFGSATLTIDRSRMTMNCDTQQTASTSCLCVGLRAVTEFRSVLVSVLITLAGPPPAAVSSVAAALGPCDRLARRGYEVPRAPLGPDARAGNEAPALVCIQGVPVVEHLSAAIGAPERR